VTKPRARFFQSVVAHDKTAISILLAKGPFHFVAFAIGFSIKPPKHPRNSDRLFGIAAIRVNHGDEPSVSHGGFVVFGVESRVERYLRTFEEEADSLGKAKQHLQGFRENNRVIPVDWCND
jgi:hypothetical protein